METIQIDATNKRLGRLASEIAGLLQGKNRADWRANVAIPVKTIIVNTDKIVFSGKKLDQKKYYRHTGTIGHLKTTPLHRQFKEDSRKVLYGAVRGMLPKNRLRERRLKNLIMNK